MIKCPYCVYENIEGVDVCEQCGQSLSDSHLRGPKNSLERGLLKDRVKTLEAKPPVVVAENTAVGDVVSMIADMGTGCAFVADGAGALTGVFSERDALHRIGCKLVDLWEEPVAKYMSPNPQSLRPHAKIAFAVHKMDVGHFRHVPIVDEDGSAVGVISVREILGYLTDKSAADQQA